MKQKMGAYLIMVLISISEYGEALSARFLFRKLARRLGEPSREAEKKKNNRINFTKTTLN